MSSTREGAVSTSGADGGTLAFACPHATHKSSTAPEMLAVQIARISANARRGKPKLANVRSIGSGEVENLAQAADHGTVRSTLFTEG